jgi:hypothetical protein
MSYFIVKTREPTRNNIGKTITYKMRKNATESTTEAIKSFFRSRILKNEQLATGEDGLYTWILKSDGSFYAAKTFTKQEIGTLHVNLDMLTRSAMNRKEDVYAAGELQLEHGDYGTVHVEFNLLSGTYMAPRFKGLTGTEVLNIRAEIVSDIQQRLFSWGIPSTFLECSSSCSEEERVGGTKLLESADIKTTPENIAMLNSMFERSGGSRRIRRSRKRTMKRRQHRPLKNRL